MGEFFTVSVIVATLASGIRLAAPFLLAGLGETIGQRSGVLNLGVEGVMLLGAYGAYYTSFQTDSPWLGVGVSVLVGAAMGLVYAFITLVMKAEQGISGIGIFLFGLGFSDLLFQKQIGTPRGVEGLPRYDIPVLSDIKYLGEIFFSHNALVYAAFLLVPVFAFVINRTTFGLNVRAVGETPEAADTLGVSVNRVRLATIVIGNVFAGLAGAALALDRGTFQSNFTAGRGFIAIALVYFGAWRPVGTMVGALLFGMVLSMVNQWRALEIISGPASSLTGMAPAVLTIVVLVIISRRVGQPSALTKPFDRTA